MLGNKTRWTPSKPTRDSAKLLIKHRRMIDSCCRMIDSCCVSVLNQRLTLEAYKTDFFSVVHFRHISRSCFCLFNNLKIKTFSCFRKFQLQLILKLFKLQFFYFFHVESSASLKPSKCSEILLFILIVFIN